MHAVAVMLGVVTQVASSPSHDILSLQGVVSQEHMVLAAHNVSFV